MRVLLDDASCPMDARYVGEAVTAAATLAERQGRMIIDVVVDGRAWTDGQLDDLAADRTEAAEVRLRSVEPGALVLQTLGDATEALAVAGERQRQAAELLEADRIQEAMEHLEVALDTWTEVQQALALSLQVTGVDPAAIRIDERSGTEIIEGLRSRLELVRSSLQAQDPIGLSDTLLYELPEVIQAWRDLLARIGEAIESPAASPARNQEEGRR